MKKHNTFEELYNSIFPLSDEIAIIYYENEERKEISYSEYRNIIDSYAAYFEKKLESIKKRRWVGLKIGNSPMWFAILFSLQKLGYQVLLLDENASDILVEHFIIQSDMGAIITNTADKYQISIQIDLGDYVESTQKPEHIEWASKIAFCTSGTTGISKIYVFSAQSIMMSCDSLCKIYGQKQFSESIIKKPENHKKRALLCLPYRHVSGFIFVLACWKLKNSLVIPKGKGILKIIETINKEKTEVLFCVPAMWNALLKIMLAKYGSNSEESFKKMFGEDLRVGISAAANLNEELISILKNSGLIFFNAWGMTEAGVCSVGTIKDDCSNGYVGEKINGHSITIVEKGKHKTSGIGEVVLEGGTLFDATLKDGKEIPRNGPYYSGDIMKYENKKLYFIGRCKNVIIGSCGENVYPEELEEHFVGLNSIVNNYCIVGYQDEPTMFVYTDKYQYIDKNVIGKFVIGVNKTLPIIKQITKVFVCKTQLPVDSKGEIHKILLNKYYLENNEHKLILLKGVKL